jgi:cytochrome c oxidase cbb3-type subunit 3
MKNLNKVILAFVILIMVGALATSTLTTENSLQYMANPVTWLVIVAAFFLIIAFMATFQALDAMKFMLAKKEGRLPADESEAEADEEEDEWLSGIMQKLTDATPVEEEEKVATDHVYDDIRELDNNLPPWWLAGFYISIVFAVVYLLRYHVFQSAPLQEEEFKIEMAAAEVAKEEYLKNAANLVDESNVIMVETEARLLSGKAIFTKSCAVCHSKDGGGGVGPNLTDDYWIHGNKIADVFSTVKYGVPAKGMIPWKDQLNPAEMQNVASYVMTLVGTTPVKAKEPQGELMTAPSATEEAPAALESDSTTTETTTEEEAITSL